MLRVFVDMFVEKWPVGFFFFLRYNHTSLEALLRTTALGNPVYDDMPPDNQLHTTNTLNCMRTQSCEMQIMRIEIVSVLACLLRQ